MTEFECHANAAIFRERNEAVPTAGGISLDKCSTSTSAQVMLLKLSIAQAGKAVPNATRKLVANLRPGENRPWTTDGFRSGEKLAVNTIDVETIGSIASKGRRGGSRSLR